MWSSDSQVIPATVCSLQELCLQMPPLYTGMKISTFPDYPAEIRAPQGTVSGVSGFQVHVGQANVKTPGDLADVLVSMNPAALMANAKFAKPGGSIILDQDSFDEQGLEKAGFKTMDPVKELQLEDYNVIWAPITSLTKESLKDSGLDPKSICEMQEHFHTWYVLLYVQSSS
jgi:2-oxoglutarate ferredoxin oxidoreductase subunit alpha